MDITTFAWGIDSSISSAFFLLLAPLFLALILPIGVSFVNLIRAAYQKHSFLNYFLFFTTIILASAPLYLTIVFPSSASYATSIITGIVVTISAIKLFHKINAYPKLKKKDLGSFNRSVYITLLLFVLHAGLAAAFATPSGV